MIGAGGRVGQRSVTAGTAIMAIALALGAAPAQSRSLYDGAGPRPGPDLLYAKPKEAAQLTNHGIWDARPILVSGASAYRQGEFLYQDFLYDDHGARKEPDPNDPRAPGGTPSDLFSKPNGTYTYPKDSDYANNAADLVELRVTPLRHSTAFRVTLNTLKDPALVAFSMAIGGKKGELHPFPHGANVSAPAELFLTVHGDQAELVRADDGSTVEPAPQVSVDKRRRQIEVRVAHRAWDPGSDTVRLAMGVGLWDQGNDGYLLPRPASDETQPGGAGGDAEPAAFFNVAFRDDEAVPSPSEGLEVVTSAAWWRDRKQGTALADGDISPFHANVDFRKLERKVRDDDAIPTVGPIDRILPSHFELSQGADFSQTCLTSAATCLGQYQGRLQPYAIYVPSKRPPQHGYGMTLLLHSLSANYNQYLSSRNQRQFGERGPGSIVITPEARGPDESYENYGAADVFDVWADVARRYRLDADWTVITGYSMGGVGTFKLGSQFPDLFARAQPTVGFEFNLDVLASLRNVPVLMWNNHGDELVNDATFNATSAKLDSLGYRYELDAFQNCANPGCSPLFPNHLQLAVNDQYAPAADFLGNDHVDRDPAHVTYVLDEARNHKDLDLVGDHAYWISDLTLRDSSQEGPTGDPEGQVDAVSHGFGKGDPDASATKLGAGTLTGGNLGPLTFERRFRTWGPAPRIQRRNQIDIDATNIATVSIQVRRAHVNCDVKVNVTSDGPIIVALPGCGRKIQSG